MLFKNVPGNKNLAEHLVRSARQGRVSHALLLNGPEGSAAFPLALAYAQYLVCTDDKNEDACGTCPACQRAAKFIHPDIHFVFPVATSKEVKADPISDRYIKQWRSFITENPYPGLQQWMGTIDVENKQGGIFNKEAESILRKMSLKAFESDYKIMIIWLPEKMNATTANKLLKLIEEPPAKTVFLLVSENTDAMLATIISRTQVIKIPRFTEAELAECLISEYPAKEKEIRETVALAQGNYIQAVDLLNRSEQIQYYHEQFIQWLRWSYKFNIRELLNWLPVISAIGRERQKTFLQYGLHLVRENFLMNRQLPELAKMTPAELEFSEKFNRFIHPGNVEQISTTLGLAIRHIEMNANPRILFLDLSAKLNKQLQIKAN